jgi:predicted 3-demethylubiquinone-9 3-methyltransferase (glyoxalase superfamily)
MEIVSKIVPCLWFDHEGEEAARYYCKVFPDSRITQIARYGEVGQEIHGGKPGSVMTVAFELAGQAFTALNGGPVFKFTEALSLQVMCDSQQEVDHYWSALSAGGDPAAQQCGWVKDRWGLSWQVVPKQLLDWILDPDRAAAERTFAAMLQMKKLDLETLRCAHAGA